VLDLREAGVNAVLLALCATFPVAYTAIALGSAVHGEAAQETLFGVMSAALWALWALLAKSLRDVPWTVAELGFGPELDADDGWPEKTLRRQA
jgi:hypothetical protein